MEDKELARLVIAHLGKERFRKWPAFSLARIGRECGAVTAGNKEKPRLLEVCLVHRDIVAGFKCLEAQQGQYILVRRGQMRDFFLSPSVPAIDIGKLGTRMTENGRTRFSARIDLINGEVTLLEGSSPSERRTKGRHAFIPLAADGKVLWSMDELGSTSKEPRKEQEIQQSAVRAFLAYCLDKLNDLGIGDEDDRLLQVRISLSALSFGRNCRASTGIPSTGGERETASIRQTAIEIVSNMDERDILNLNIPLGAVLAARSSRL